MIARLLGSKKVDFLFCVLILVFLSFTEVTARILRDDASELLTAKSNMTDDSVSCSADESQKLGCLNGGECVKSIGSNLKTCRCPTDFEGELCENKAMPSLESLYMAKIYIPVIVTAIVGVVVFTLVIFCMKCRKQKRGYEPCKEETPTNTSPR